MNPIGINWGAVWDDTVWDPVWLQSSAVVVEDTDGAPKPKRRVRSRITRKVPAKPRAVKRAKRVTRAKRVEAPLPPIRVELIVPPPAIREFAQSVPPLPAVVVSFEATLEGCRMEVAAAEVKRMSVNATLEGCALEVVTRQYVWDDALQIVLGKEYEPELVEL